MVNRAIAVVIDLGSTTGLQTARVLASHDIPVIGLARDRRNYCARTNVCRNIVGVDTRSNACIVMLQKLSVQFQTKPVLYPCSDHSVMLLARHRELLEPNYHILQPKLEVLELLMDKAKFADYAIANNLAIPPTIVVRSEADAQDAANVLRFPCIAKPPLRNEAWMRDAGFKVIRLGNAEEWVTLYERCRTCNPTVVLQEWIEGDDTHLYGAYCYFDAGGRALASFVARKLRQWPPECGVGSLAQEIRNDVVLNQALRLFTIVRFHGLCALEMKWDAISGDYFIMEANVGRPTSRTGLEERAGAPLIYTSYCDAVGLPLPTKMRQACCGIKWVSLRFDLQSAFYYWRHNRLTLKGWWRSMRGPKVYAVFSWRDPLPFWLDICACVTKLLKRLVSRSDDDFLG